MTETNTEGMKQARRNDGTTHSEENPMQHMEGNDNPTQIEEQNHISSTSHVTIHMPESNQVPTHHIESDNSGNHEVNNKMNTALHLAVKEGHGRRVQDLIDKGADRTKGNKYGETPLHLAARHESTKCLEILLKAARKTDICQVDKKGKNILHHAVEQGAGTQKAATSMKYILEFLETLEKGIVDQMINECSSKVGSPLNFALIHRNYDCIYSLLDKGASLDRDSHHGKYPFLFAAKEGMQVVCTKMIEMNRSVLKQMNPDNQTALHLAASENRDKVVDIISKKMKVNKIQHSGTDKKGQTALHMAVVGKGDETITRLLLQTDISVKKKDLEDSTALHLAAIKGKRRCCELLVEKSGKSLYIRNNSGKDPLDLAFEGLYSVPNRTKDNEVVKNNIETILYLLKKYSEDYRSYLKENSNHSKMRNVDKFTKCEKQMAIYLERAIAEKLYDVTDAIINSAFWEVAIFGRNEKDGPTDNFKNLLNVFPKLALEVQGKCIKSSTPDETVYSFRPYEGSYYMEDESSPFDEHTGELKAKAIDRDQDVYAWNKNHPINLMISKTECELFKHPLTLAWLRQKWKSYIQYIHYLMLIIESLYLASLVSLMATTWYVSQFSCVFDGNYMLCWCRKRQRKLNDCREPNDFRKMKLHRCRKSELNCYRMIQMFCCLKTQLYRYCKMIYDQVTVIIQIFQLILTMIILFAPFGMCYTGRIGLLQENWVWQCGVLSVLFAWIDLVNSVNIAMMSVFLPIAQDFLEMFMRFFYFLIVFVVIFAFIFHLLLVDQDSFASVPQSIGSTILLMLTEFSYKDFFVDVKPSFPIFSNFMFFVFITTIGCVILSVLNKERRVKSRGKDLDNNYRRLAIYARMIFSYDMCFPQFRRHHAVITYKIKKREANVIEYYLDEIENAKAQEEVSQDNKKIKERIKRLEIMMTEINDNGKANKLQLSRIEDLLTTPPFR